MAFASLLKLTLLSAASIIADAVMKGVSYGVSPGQWSVPANDDFFCDAAAQQWSRWGGRGDLALMEAMGANSVRLYGNDPRQPHARFLNEAHEHHLRVIPGNSFWPFSQSPDNCKSHSNYVCNWQVKNSYLMNLRNGFLQADRSYHPAISHIIVLNEPELLLPDVSHPIEFTRALISAMDGMLDAEREAGAHPGPTPLPNFTITYSFSQCWACERYREQPALGQMWHLRDAIYNPRKYGYSPRNNLQEMFRTRFTFSFNTANPYFHMQPLLLDYYTREFPTTPVFIGEYHWPNVHGDQEHDLRGMLKIAESTPLLLGISFFEFQLRTDLAGHENFGMLRQGPRSVAQMNYFGEQFAIKCLVPVQDDRGWSIPSQVAAAYGGNVGLFQTDQCVPSGTSLRR